VPFDDQIHLPPVLEVGDVEQSAGIFGNEVFAWHDRRKSAEGVLGAGGDSEPLPSLSMTAATSREARFRTVESAMRYNLGPTVAGPRVGLAFFEGANQIV
jgi:hypothetical protein